MSRTLTEARSLDRLQYRFLRWAFPREPQHLSGGAYAGRSKLRILLGDALLESVRDRTVVDFGCGDGSEAVDLVRHGARRVIGVDIRPPLLEAAARSAAAAGVAHACTFTTTPVDRADIVVCIDAFEHFADPAAMLRRMADLLVDDGFVATSFGPTWFHPYGGHLFSVFPWAHLLFSEPALVRWRSHLRNDGATRFAEVEGGLNQMTIRRFEQLVAASPLRMDFIEAVPIRRLAWCHNRVTREFTTSVVRARLRKPPPPSPPSAPVH